MEKNEIKKALYKAKPAVIAKFRGFPIRQGVAIYDAVVDGQAISFNVSIPDLGHADLDEEMEAKFLIRYLND